MIVSAIVGTARRLVGGECAKGARVVYKIKPNLLELGLFASASVILALACRGSYIVTQKEIIVCR